MRFLALADTHLGYFAGRSAEARRQIALHAYQQFMYCIQQAIDHNVDYIIHAGDVFNRSQPPKWIMAHYYQAIEQALQQEIGLLVIPGNHDKAELDNSLLEFMYPNYHVFNSLRTIEIGVQVIGLPFVYKTHNQVMNYIEKKIQQTSNATIVIAHQLFDGATFGPQQYTFQSRKDVYQISHLPDRVQFISGHVHRAQVLEQAQVVYTGSTIRTSFAEMIEPKGYILGEIEENTIRMNFKPIPSMDMVVIELDGRYLNLEQLDDQLGKIERQTRVLVRLLHTKVDQQLVKRLYQRYEQHRWPYLRITPRSPNRQLSALYHRRIPFQFDGINREW